MTIHEQRMNYIIDYAKNIINEHNINANKQNIIDVLIKQKINPDFKDIIKSECLHWIEYFVNSVLAQQNITNDTITNDTITNIINYTIENIPHDINNVLDNKHNEFISTINGYAFN